MKTRIEKDELGQRQVPYEAYYGIQTLRSKENFDIAKRPISRQMIKGLAIVKKACAYANFDAGLINREVLSVISLSCDEIFNGRLHGQFITDLVQGGAGISMNMNANEVIANRANEMLGYEKGSYNPVHPIDTLNLNQSNNDVVPTAGKIASIFLTKRLLVEMKKLANVYDDLADKYNSVMTVGLTHLQASVPVSYGELFRALKHSVERDAKRISQAMNNLLEVNLGGNIIGNGANTDVKFSKKVIKYLAEFSGEDFYQSKNMIDCTRSMDAFAYLSSTVKAFTLNLQKNVNDLKLLTCCYDRASLPEVQAGSFVNLGKINPVVLEMVSQVVFYMEGNDLTISRATQAGEMEFNVNIPIILACLFENLNFIRRCIRTLREKCLEDLVVYGASKEELFETRLLSYFKNKLGYDKTIEIHHKAIEENKKFSEIIIENQYLSDIEIEKLRDN